MPLTWQRIVIAVVMIFVASGIAKLVDARISKRALAPEAVTRYRVLRRTIFATIVFVGVMSALLVIPQVRGVAGGVLASSAVIGLVIGFASQRVLGNVIAGILIAFAQPLRLGDEVEVEGIHGIVEEIGLSFTWIRTHDNDRLVVPNENIAANSLRNSTIRSPRTLAEVSVQVPMSADLRAVLTSLREDADEVYVSDLGEKATFVVRRWVPGEEHSESASSDLRLAVADRLKAAGIIKP